jgi:hypothetical protein
MRETVDRALTRLRNERGDTRPEEVLVSIQTIGGATVLCPADNLVDVDGDVGVTSQTYLIADATVDVQEVR